MNYIPIVGWLIDLALKISLAIPFWLIWTVWGLGVKYFPFLPIQFQVIPFWNTVGLFMAIPILLHIITPRFVSCSNENKQEVKNEVPTR